jgi:large conductance mechanosensitive channel
MLKEFKEFALKGSFVDLAIGVIVGGAVGKVVSSLVTDLIMPPIGALLGKVDFASLYVNLSGETYSTYAAAKAAGAPVIGYGMFLNIAIEFLIVMLVIFVLVKAMNKLRREKPIETGNCPYCLTTVPIAATRCPACTSELEQA